MLRTCAPAQLCNCTGQKAQHVVYIGNLHGKGRCNESFEVATCVQQFCPEQARSVRAGPRAALSH